MLTSREACVAADEADPLRSFRDLFDLPPDVIYLDGNSLGALPRAARQRASEVVSAEWGHDLINSWNRHDWFGLPGRLGDKIAQLIGGTPGSCVATDTTSINIFKALSAKGKVTMPFQETFWASGFGALVDQFGTPWMINCNKAE